jgi:hypothetical protein
MIDMELPDRPRTPDSHVALAMQRAAAVQIKEAIQMTTDADGHVGPSFLQIKDPFHKEIPGFAYVLSRFT